MKNKKIKDGRSLSHELLEGYRMAAVKLRRRGIRVKDLASSFGVRPEVVSRWCGKAKEAGLRSLRSTCAAGPAPRMGRDDFDKFLSLLRRPATELGYSTDLWSGPRIRHLLKHQFMVEYHSNHIPRLLRRLGLVLKFPERRALEQDPSAVRRWKTHTLPKILKDSRKRGALVFYADESLISLIPYIGKTWTFPKAKPIVKVSGRRGQHVGITAAVNQKGRLCFELTREGERFTSKIFLRFIRKLRREVPSRPVVLIVDGAPTHKAKIVEAFKKENRSWLRLEILPAYSPELNPTEKVWGFAKTKKMNGSTVADKAQLREETKKVMREIRKNSKRVVSFFNN